MQVANLMARAAAALCWLAMGCGLVACGADSDPGTTRVAVQNDSAGALALELRSPAEVDMMSFSDVNAGTTSSFVNVHFENLADLEVVIIEGQAVGGTVTLRANADNTLIISQAPPVVRVAAPPVGTVGGGGW